MPPEAVRKRCRTGQEELRGAQECLFTITWPKGQSDWQRAAFTLVLQILSLKGKPAHFEYNVYHKRCLTYTAGECRGLTTSKSKFPVSTDIHFAHSNCLARKLISQMVPG